ncbi:DUF6003 family protein [Streptomyces vinaceus]|uniref:DUF6003 family protein n=1 Tax=Streptomyces vinaceus TaxID=1960 RepID=UPI0036CBDD16
MERVRRATPTDRVRVAGIGEEPLAFRDSKDNRHSLLRRAVAAGVPAHRIVEPVSLPRGSRGDAPRARRARRRWPRADRPRRPVGSDRLSPRGPAPR